MTDFSALPDEMKRRFAYLVERYVADTLSETESEDLYRLIVDSPETKRILQRHFMLDLDLQAKFSPLDPDEIEKEIQFSPMDALALQVAQNSLDQVGPATIRRKKVESTEEQSNVRKKGARILAVSALLLFFVFVSLHEFRIIRFNDSKDNVSAAKAFRSLGVITAVADTVFADEKPIFQLNQRLTNEEIALVDGMIELKLDNGVRLVLEGPGSLRLNSTMKTFCHEGRLSVHVPPEGKGFEVASPHLTVRDLGTEFVLEVSDDATELHVIQGEVESNWLTSEWLSFTEGGGVRVDADHKTRQLAADATLFATEQKMFEKSRVFMQKQETAYHSMLDRFRDDPKLMVLFDSEGNEVGNPRVLADRDRAGSLPSRKAFVFKNERARIEYSLSETVDSLTLWASVRLDRFERANALLLSKRFYDDSGILWQIGMDGSLQFHQRVGERILQYDSPTVLGREKEGVWIHLTSVVDAEQRMVSHYLNNRLVAEIPYEPHPMTLGDVVVGNEWPGGKKTTRRYWNGLMETFVGLGRALNPTELFTPEYIP